MAGGHHGEHPPVKLDGGVESWNYMRENVYKSFKFNSRTVKTSLLVAGLIPAVAYLVIAPQDQKWDWQGKKRSDVLLRKPPTAEAEA